MSGRNLTIHALAIGALALVAGCFDEPVPARETVPPQARVYLSDHGLGDLRGAQSSLAYGTGIDYLNLDRNNLTNVDEVVRLTGLKWLRLNGNRLSALPDLSALTQLRRIYLKNNLLPSVPPSLEALPNLTDIDLSGNPIREIPDWLAKKEGLENLSFSRTLVTKLPDDLSAWRGLHSLQLGELKLGLQEMKRIRAALPNVAIVY